MLTLAVAAAGMGLIALVLTSTLGLQRAVIVASVCTLTVVPIELVGFGTPSTMSHTTIAAGRVSISTHDLALLTALSLSGLSILRRSRVEFVVVAMSSFAITMVCRQLTPWVAEGILQWVLLSICWGLGASLSAQVRDGRLTERFIAGTLLACVGLHASACAAQLVGIGRVYQSEIAGGALSRMTGLAGHPGNLGKIVLLLVILILPLTSSNDLKTRRMAWSALLLALVTIAVTYSRANVGAAAVLLVGWFVFRSGKAGLSRFIVPAVASVVSIPVIQILLERQKYDPEGGLRPELMQIALTQLHETFWWGVGPNNYIWTVGQYDPYARGGLPVHSTFVLMLVELGAIVSVAAALPLIVLVLRGFRRFLRDRHPYAMVLLLTLPGGILIMATGHGMTSRVVAPTFILVLGYLWDAISDPPVQPESPSADRAPLHSRATDPTGHHPPHAASGHLDSRVAP